MATNENRIAAGLDQLSGALAQIRIDTVGRIDRLEHLFAEIDTYWRRQSDLLGEALHKSDLTNVRQVELSLRDDDLQMKLARLEQEVLQLSNRLPAKAVESPVAEIEPVAVDGEARAEEAHHAWAQFAPAPSANLESMEFCIGADQSHLGGFGPVEPETDVLGANDLSKPDARPTISTGSQPSTEQENAADPKTHRVEQEWAATDLRVRTVPGAANLDPAAPDRFRWRYLLWVLGALLGIAVLAAMLMMGKRDQNPASAGTHSPSMRTLSLPEPTARDPNDTLFVVEIPRTEGVPPEPQSSYASPGELGSLSEKSLHDMAKNGNAKANTILGLRALDDRGAAPVSLAEAARYLKRAAEGGNAVAQFRLASLYEHGDGVKTDFASARRWYEIAANQGNRKAMHNLAVFYSSGAAGRRDLQQAAYWFAEAASLDITDSQYNLAFLYEHGYGVTKDLVEAGKWYSIAARRGDKEAKKNAELVRAQLGTNEQVLISKAAKEFRPVPFDTSANVPPDVRDL